MATAPLATAAPGRPGGALLRSSPTVGLRYGNRASFLPTTDQLIHLYQVYEIEKMWLYCGIPQDVQVLEILQYIYNHKEANIRVFLYIPTQEVGKIADGAPEWIQLIAKYQRVISHVCLGNVGDENEIPDRIVFAMDRINSINAIIKVSIIIDVNIIFGKYDPTQCPSLYTYSERFSNLLSQVFERLANTSTPLFVKTFPYFAIGNNISTGRIGLDNYLLKNCARPYMICDQNTHKYKYVFDAMVDSIACANKAMDFSNVDISVVSGWPTAGSNEATIQNAQKYNNNFLRHVNEDTPMKTKRVDHFIFSVLDEDLLNPNDVSAWKWKHFGAFTLWKNETFPPTDVEDSAEAT
ncbi:hypothetical protein AAC387_Pa04g1769 [Persea americana]